MDETQELALAQLNALVKVPGALKHVTNEHVCGIPAGQHAPRGDAERATCDAYEHDLKSIRHFVVHDVTTVEPAPDFGGDYYRAATAEGDWRVGTPTALLKRLTEASAA